MNRPSNLIVFYTKEKYLFVRRHDVYDLKKKKTFRSNALLQKIENYYIR